MIQTPATETALPLVFTETGGTSGLTVLLAIRRGTDWLDFDDDTFKPSGWVQRQVTMTEIGALALGSYEYELDVSVIGAQVGDNLVAEYEVTGVVYATELIQLVSSATVTPETQIIIDAINNQTQILLAGIEGTDCSAPSTVAPSVYTGHKGDPINLQVFRGDVLMDDAELVGATSLLINFYNTDTQQNVQITTGITTGNGQVSYTTTVGDLVYESAGKWQAQAEGVTTTGEPFRSQVLTQEVKDELQ